MSWFSSYSQRTDLPSKIFPSFVVTLPDQNNKVIVITGTTSGTGYVAAQVCAQKGATVCLLNRKSERSEAALDSLKKTAGTEKGQFVPIDCDLMSFESVKNSANQIKSLFPDGIDVLSNNAGIMMFDEIASSDGYDCQTQTNHLSHFLLTKELFPLLKKKSIVTGESRIVNHSSDARRKTNFEKKYYEKITTPGILGGNGMNAKVARYQQTKFANILFTNALQDKLIEKDIKIKAYCAHPGLAATKLQQRTSEQSGAGMMTCIMNILFAGWLGAPQSQEDGTVGLLICMLEPNLPTGGLYGPANKNWTSGPAVHIYPDEGAPNAEIKENKEQLWQVSEAACGAFLIE